MGKSTSSSKSQLEGRGSGLPIPAEALNPSTLLEKGHRFGESYSPGSREPPPRRWASHTWNDILKAQGAKGAKITM